MFRPEVNRDILSPISFLNRSADVYPDKIAVVYDDLRFTYRQFQARVHQLANALLGRGIGHGDKVVFICPNTPPMLEAHFAIPMIGAVLVCVNTQLSSREYLYIIDHSDAKAVFVDNEFAAQLQPIAGELAKVSLFVNICEYTCAPLLKGPEYETFLAGGAATPPATSGDCDENSLIAINYTSGTTGRPKGVMYSHRATCLQTLGEIIESALRPDSVYLWTLPMFHCNGWSHTWAVTAAGGTHVCLDGIEPAAILDHITRHEVTHMACAPVVLYMLLNDTGAQSLRGSGKRVSVATGGAAPTATLIASLSEMGFDLTHLYGLTESYGPASICELADDMADADPAEKARWLSRQGARHKTSGSIRIVDPETGADQPADGLSSGEILLRGNTVMAGYHRDLDATEAAFRDGWFHTGDIAVREPDGAIRITDRAKDVIISGGENISSLEVESVLHKHPAVLIAAVVAMPSEKWGETPCAFVECKPGTAVDEAEMAAFCRDHLAGFKVPRKFIFSEVPKTATGKIQKFRLREQARGLGA